MSKEITKNILEGIEKSNKAFHQILKEGFRVITSNKDDDVTLIYSIIQMYGIAKNIHLTKREEEVITMFIKYGTEKNSRKSIERQLKISAGSISQYVMRLKSKGLLVKKYEEERACHVNPELIKIINYVVEKKGNILIRFE